jgi:hypothetical protein
VGSNQCVVWRIALKPKEKAQAEKVMNELIDFLWGKVRDRMTEFGETAEQATVIVIQEVLKND